MCTCYPIINRVSELKVHIELTRFVQPEKIEIDANERAVNEKSQYCFFVCTTFDSFLNDLPICTQRFLRMFSSVFCLELRRQSQPQQFLSTGCLFLADGAREALYMISSINFLSISSGLYFLILLLFSISRIIDFSLP